MDSARAIEYKWDTLSKIFCWKGNVRTMKKRILKFIAGLACVLCMMIPFTASASASPLSDTAESVVAVGSNLPRDAALTALGIGLATPAVRHAAVAAGLGTWGVVQGATCVGLLLS